MSLRSAITYRGTWWDESIRAGRQVEEPVSRQYWDMGSGLGPI